MTAVDKLSRDAERATRKYRALTRFGRPSPLVGIPVAFALSIWAYHSQEFVIVVFAVIMWVSLVCSWDQSKMAEKARVMNRPIIRRMTLPAILIIIMVRRCSQNMARVTADEATPDSATNVSSVHTRSAHLPAGRCSVKRSRMYPR